MIVAIVDKTSPTGRVPVEEFRTADTVALAVAAFVDEYTPPKQASDYLGVDTQWAEVQTGRWVWDFAASELVRVEPRIYAFIPDRPPDVTTVNYKSGLTGRLHRKVAARFRGEVRQVDYYADESETTLVLRVTIWADAAMTVPGYARDPLGLATERWTLREWYLTDGTPGPTKTTHKRYSHDAVEQMIEGRRRRSNVMNDLIIEVLRMLIATRAVDPLNPTLAEQEAAEADGMAFLASYSDNVSDYIAVGELSWTGTPGISNDNTPWLDNDVTAYGWTGPTIRDEILAALVEITDP